MKRDQMEIPKKNHAYTKEMQQKHDRLILEIEQDDKSLKEEENQQKLDYLYEKYMKIETEILEKRQDIRKKLKKLGLDFLIPCVLGSDI